MLLMKGLNQEHNLDCGCNLLSVRLVKWLYFD